MKPLLYFLFPKTSRAILRDGTEQSDKNTRVVIMENGVPRIDLSIRELKAINVIYKRSENLLVFHL
jgi:hypothetical protein